jgi:hypothetical protein
MTIKNAIDRQERSVNEIKKILGEVIQIQRTTTENLNTLTVDTQELLRSSLVQKAHSQEIKNLEMRLKAIEENRVWLVRLVIGSIIAMLATYYFGGKM